MVSKVHVAALAYCRIMQDNACLRGNTALFVFWTKWERHVMSQCERPYTYGNVVSLKPAKRASGD